MERLTHFLNSLRAAINADSGVHFKEEYEREGHQPVIEQHLYQYSKDKHVENLKSLLSEEYKPPDDTINFLSHLKTVALFYIHTASISNNIPSHLVYKVDRAALRLSILASEHSIILRDEGYKQFRIARGINKTTAKKLLKKQPILEEYYRIDISGMSKNKIATTIRENLNKRQRDVPSLDTIKRYLREDDLI